LEPLVKIEISLPWHYACQSVDSGGTCCNCGYTRVALPPWLTEAFWASRPCVFGFEGKVWRVVSIGSINDFSHQQHFRDYAAVVQVNDEKPTLPDAPAPVAEVANVLQTLFACKKVYATDFATGKILR